MPAILLTILAALSHALIQMLMSLLTEDFLKKAIVYGLDKLVKLTESDLDDKVLSAAKEAWGMKDNANGGK
jgi:hypothetical protein